MAFNVSDWLAKYMYMYVQLSKQTIMRTLYIITKQSLYV